MGTENQEKHVKVLALTDDDSLLHVVREAAATRFSILHARELKQAVSFDALSKIGVLIADNELLMGQTENVIDRLKRRAPNMVVIIACNSDDGVKLMELVNTGKVFRVLTRPCQTGQTRLYMEAAAKRHQDLRTERESQSPSDGADLSRFKMPAMIGGAVAAVALSVALVVPFDSSESVSERLDDQTLSAGEVSQIELGLASAEVAFQAGRLFEPDDDNAVSHYQAVLEIRPAHLAAIRGLNRVANEMFVRAETALVDNRTGEARKSVEDARSIRPEHTRLAFFDAMLTKEQQKRWQLQAEQAIAGGQFEVAFGVIAEAEMSGSGIPQPLMDTVIGGVMDRAQTAIADGRTADALDLMDRARVISTDHVLLLEADQRLAEQAETLMSRAVVYAEASEFDGFARSSPMNVEIRPSTAVTVLESSRSTGSRNGMGCGTGLVLRRSTRPTSPSTGAPLSTRRV